MINFKKNCSTAAAAEAPQLRLLVLTRKYGPGKLTDARARLTRSRHGAAAQTASVESLALPGCPLGKLSKVRARLTLAFTGPVLGAQ